MKLISAAFALAIAVGFSLAAAAQDQHEAHHPSANGPSNGMMGNEMMGGRGMTSGQGMMGGGGMPMMQMMGRSGMPGMGMTDHIEGRIAFLRAELKITDAQTKLWDNFAQSLRDNAKKLVAVRAKESEQKGALTPVRRLDDQEQWYAARLDGIKEIKSALTPFYAALSDQQKETADELLPANIGLMPTRGMGMMSMSGARGGMGMDRGAKP